VHPAVTPHRQIARDQGRSYDQERDGGKGRQIGAASPLFEPPPKASGGKPSVSGTRRNAIGVIPNASGTMPSASGMIRKRSA
jgi:hypothetical protein